MRKLMSFLMRKLMREHERKRRKCIYFPKASLMGKLMRKLMRKPLGKLNLSPS